MSLASAAANAAAMADARIKRKTTKGYINKVNAFSVFNKSHAAEYGGGDVVEYLPVSSSDLSGLPKAPIPLKPMKDFLGHLTLVANEDANSSSSDDDDDDDDDDEGAAAPKKKRKKKKACLSTSHVSSHKSALKWCFQMQNTAWSATFETELGEIMMGFKKTVAGLKVKGVVSNVEGKLPLAFVGYCLLAKKMLKCQPKTGPSVENPSTKKKHKSHLFSWAINTLGWVFLLLSWSLIARSITVAEINLSAISWEDDRLRIFVGKSKKDQSGDKSSGWR